MQFHNFSEIALFIGKLEKKGALKQKTRREPTSTKKTSRELNSPMRHSGSGSVREGFGYQALSIDSIAVSVFVVILVEFDKY